MAIFSWIYCCLWSRLIHCCWICFIWLLMYLSLRYVVCFEVTAPRHQLFNFFSSTVLFLLHCCFPIYCVVDIFLSLIAIAVPFLFPVCSYSNPCYWCSFLFSACRYRLFFSYSLLIAFFSLSSLPFSSSSTCLCLRFLWALALFLFQLSCSFRLRCSMFLFFSWSYSLFLSFSIDTDNSLFQVC